MNEVSNRCIPDTQESSSWDWTDRSQESPTISEPEDTFNVDGGV